MTIIPLAPSLLTGSSSLPGGFGRAVRHRTLRGAVASLFGLAPCGVLPAIRVATSAVRSYRTFSPLPRLAARLRRCDVRRYVFCATVLRVAPTGRYPAHCPAEFGLSSPRLATSARARRVGLVWPSCERRVGDRLARCGGTLRVAWHQPSRFLGDAVLLELLVELLRGVPMTSAVFEMFQPFSRSFSTRNARSADSLNSRSVPGAPVAGAPCAARRRAARRAGRRRADRRRR